MVYLQHLKCQGLYSYGEPIELAASDRMIIVGPNNAGKSNLFKLIGLVVDTFLERRRLENYEIAKDNFNPFVEISIKLSKEETKMLIDFMSFYPEKPNEGSNFFEYENHDLLVELFNTLFIRLSWKREAEIYGAEPYLEIEFPKIGLKLYSYIFSGLRISNYFPSEREEKGYDSEVGLYELLCRISDQENAKTIVSEFFESRVIGMPRLKIDRNKEISDRGKETIVNLYSCLDISLEVHQEIQFTELLATIFRKGIIYSSDRRGINGPTILDYAEMFKIDDNTGTIQQEDTLDYNKVLEATASSKAIELTKTLRSDGSNLALFLFSLKNSQNYDERLNFEKIKKAFEGLFQAERLSFDVILKYHEEKRFHVRGGSPLTKPKLPIIIMIDNKLNKQFPANQTGSGISEAIYLLTLGFGVENCIILLDEPSVNLHPPLMRSLMNRIQDYAKNNQFLIITHSPELVSFELFEKTSKIFYVRRMNLSSQVKTLEGKTKEWFEKERNKLRHQIDARIFFAKSVILTEGESDKNLLSGIADYLESQAELDLNGNDVIITGIGGKMNFSKYMDLLDTLGIPYTVLADSDAKNLFETSCTITKDGLSGASNVFVIKNGNLEDLMNDVDSTIFSSAQKENRKSKPALAYAFAEKIKKTDPKKLNSFRSLLLEAVKQAQ